MKFSKVLKETLKFNPFDTFRSPQLQLVKYIYETNWGKTTTIKQKYSWPSGSMDSTSADAINHEIKTILKKKKKKLCCCGYVLCGSAYDGFVYTEHVLTFFAHHYSLNQRSPPCWQQGPVLLRI